MAKKLVTNAVEYWLKKNLPADILKRALKNLDADKIYLIVKEKLALASAFYWPDSPEGDKYWNAVDDKFFKMKDDTNIPDPLNKKPAAKKSTIKPGKTYSVDINKALQKSQEAAAKKLVTRLNKVLEESKDLLFDIQNNEYLIKKGLSLKTQFHSQVLPNDKVHFEYSFKGNVPAFTK